MKLGGWWWNKLYAMLLLIDLEGNILRENIANIKAYAQLSGQTILYKQGNSSLNNLSNTRLRNTILLRVV